MKILLIRTIATEFNSKVKTYNAQGVGLATELSRLGHECGLVYFAKNGNEFTETIETDGFKIKVYHIGGKRISTNAIYDKKINSICREYDIIQPSECDQIASWLIYRKFPEKTIIYHGPYKSKFTKKYNLRSKIFDFIFLNKCNFKNVPVITKSYLAEEYLRNKGFKNITTIGVGLNPYFLEEKNETKDKNVEKLIENKKNSKYILYIGTISKRKNLKFILKLLDELVNKEVTEEPKKEEYKSINDLLEEASEEIPLDDTLEMPISNNLDVIEEELEKIIMIVGNLLILIN